jgi:hypothetical protein
MQAACGPVVRCPSRQRAPWVGAHLGQHFSLFAWPDNSRRGEEHTKILLNMRSSSCKGQKSIASFFSRNSDVPLPAQQDTPCASKAPTVSRRKPTENVDATVSHKRDRSEDAAPPASDLNALALSKRGRTPVDSQAQTSSVVHFMTAPQDSADVPTALQAAAPKAVAPTNDPGCIPARDPVRQALAKRKLTIKRERMVLGPDASTKVTKGVKYTPLEQQVMDLKKRNPGKVLLVEVRKIAASPHYNHAHFAPQSLFSDRSTVPPHITDVTRPRTT